MATPATSAPEQRESREHEKSGKIVVVELDEPQSAVSIRRLRKGKGKLFKHVEQIVKDLGEDGTVKSGAQPIVIVVREMPSPPWAFGDDDDD